MRRFVPAQDFALVPPFLIVVDPDAHDARVCASRALLRVLALEAKLRDQHSIERRNVGPVRDDENTLLFRLRSGFEFSSGGGLRWLVFRCVLRQEALHPYSDTGAETGVSQEVGELQL